ncbi:hypothetical protein SanaruYs_05490 [Chryseotalea sanaruensis]|uniref:Guanylate cyclase domain-containing protein n=1 Tax=Chryseotalea sanaruensis TaxID=2482724 RepID=A0A401U5V0_9BACT|nr:hypothetical protein [Chryseotalea sanaruensis]GCC50334.1 hypothetical protein SanaruYs_05490 [Chryseotalea sanaruensis]
MPIHNFSGTTFVAFTDISGFKELMKNDKRALDALRHFYQAGYDSLSNDRGIEGFFISDSGILFAREGNNQEKLTNLLLSIKEINRLVLERNYMLTTSISFGAFDYHDKLEFEGIEKNPIYGYAYVQSFLDNETGKPRIQPGQCRLVKKNLPLDIVITPENFPLLKSAGGHYYYYWNVESPNEIESFENRYNDSYSLKYEGMLKALKG